MGLKAKIIEQVTWPIRGRFSSCKYKYLWYYLFVKFIAPYVFWSLPCQFRWNL